VGTVVVVVVVELGPVVVVVPGAVAVVGAAGVPVVDVVVVVVVAGPDAALPGVLMVVDVAEAGACGAAFVSPGVVGVGAVVGLAVAIVWSGVVPVVPGAVGVVVVPGVAVSGAGAAVEASAVVVVVVDWVVVAGAVASVVVVVVVAAAVPLTAVPVSEGFCEQAVTLIKQRPAMAAAIICFCMVFSLVSAVKNKNQ